MVTLADLQTRDKNNWCPGCGNFGLITALKQSIVELGIEPHNVLLVSGIGCHAASPHYVDVYGIHTLHGRPMPVATGAKLANHDLHVVAMSGDGDGYGIGMGHFVHSMRRNTDLTYIVHDNQVYGLTTGQYSPTSQRGYKSKSSPQGTIEDPVNPVALALSAGATYIARGFAGDVAHLKTLFSGALKHKGFALVDVLQPCVTWNRINTFEFWRSHLYKLEDSGHDAADFNKAYAKAIEWGEKIPYGLFYKTDKPTLVGSHQTLQKGSLVKQPLQPNVSKLMDDFI